MDAAARRAQNQQSSVTERVGRGALRVFYQLWYTYRLGGTADENFRCLWPSAGLAHLRAQAREHRGGCQASSSARTVSQSCATATAVSDTCSDSTPPLAQCWQAVCEARGRSECAKREIDLFDRLRGREGVIKAPRCRTRSVPYSCSHFSVCFVKREDMIDPWDLRPHDELVGS